MAAYLPRVLNRYLKQGIEKFSRGQPVVTGTWVLSTKQAFSSSSKKDQDSRLYSEVNIEVKGSDEAVLASYSQFVKKAAECLDINTNKVTLPTNIERYTLLKSPHIYKKHRVQYEIRTHRLLLQFIELTGETADVFLEYIQRNCPEGVSVDIQQVELENIDLNMPGEAKAFLESQKQTKSTRS